MSPTRRQVMGAGVGLGVASVLVPGPAVPAHAAPVAQPA